MFTVRALAENVGGQYPQTMLPPPPQSTPKLNGVYQRLGIVEAKTLATILYQISVRLEDQAHQYLTGQPNVIFSFNRMMFINKMQQIEIFYMIKMLKVSGKWQELDMIYHTKGLYSYEMPKKVVSDTNKFDCSCLGKEWLLIGSRYKKF